MLASTLRLSYLVNRIDLGVATEQERAVHRLLVNYQQVRHVGAGQPGHPPGAGDHGGGNGVIW